MSTTASSLQPKAETRAFGAEVKQLLHLVTHALYSNREIFLRELISNASDAADKLRYQALSDASLYESDSTLKIWVDINNEQKTITVRDNGLGMSRDEAVLHLGTIAQSGTRAFRDSLANQENKDNKEKTASDSSNLIGQFGVGFYSAFIVADQVTVRTRKGGVPTSQGVEWTSDGSGEFTVTDREVPQRGTEIILHMKEDATEFLNDYRLKNIIKKYSDHILLPIVMQVPVPEKPAAVSDEASETDNKDEETVIEEPQTTEEVVNRASALWTVAKADIKKEDYTAFYQHISNDFEDPMTWAHNKVEGTTEYTSLLYIPKRAPFDLWNRDTQRGLKLYVRRVFIMDDVESFLPMYLRFVKGIVDSNNLPLNISREVLQSSKDVDRIRTGCTKRVLSMVEKLAKDDAAYAEFWKTFGQVLKEGPVEDFAHKDRVSKLLRFASTQSDEQTVALQSYVDRMQEKQEKIYYLIAENHAAAKNSPLLEVFHKKGIEVLLLGDRIDEWLMNSMNDFAGKTFESIAKGSLDLGDLDDKQDEANQEQTEKDFSSLLEQMKTLLKDDVKDIRLTHRLSQSPACVVTDDDDMSAQMQRIMQAAGQQAPVAKPILELNPEHALVLKAKAETDEERIQAWARLLLDQAILAEGEALKDPSGFVKQLNLLLATA